jgi:hypothetical protein
MVEATVTHSGRTLAFVDVTVSSGDDRRCTTIVGTWSLNLLAPADRTPRTPLGKSTTTKGCLP